MGITIDIRAGIGDGLEVEIYGGFDLILAFR